MRLLCRNAGSGEYRPLSVRGKVVVIMLKANITDADIFGGEAKLVGDISRYGSRGILLDEQNLCAVLEAEGGGFLKLPGGGIDLGERESDAFVRGVLEQTGCKCSVITQLGTVAEHKGKSNFCQFSFAYLARKTSGGVSADADFALRWLMPEDACAAFRKAFEESSDVKMKFMMKRDLIIIEYLMEQVAAGEISI